MSPRKRETAPEDAARETTIRAERRDDPTSAHRRTLSPSDATSLELRSRPRHWWLQELSRRHAEAVLRCQCAGCLSFVRRWAS
jgi:hypothetical protein